MILFISYYFVRFKTNVYFAAALQGIRPLSVSLIGIAAISLMNEENFTEVSSPLIFVVTLLLAIKYRLHPILILGLSAVLGLLIY